MGLARGALTALGKVGIVLGIAVAFLFGMVGTVYLSLRTSEVQVPDLSGKDRFTAESQLADIGLKIRVRGTRPSTDKKPDTILNQLPEAGLIVKEGIEVAVEVTRAPKEGESVPSSSEETPPQTEVKPADNANAQADNTNQTQNQNKPKNKNINRSTNKNANNSNNSNNSNNANRNANAGNRNANRNANNANRGTTNTTPAPNRNSSNPNANRRVPVTTPPFNPGANRQTP